MSHTMEVDSQDSSAASSQTVAMEDDCTFGHRLVGLNEMGEREDQTIPKCNIDISSIYMKEGEHAISESDIRHRLETENEVLQSDRDAKAAFDESALEHRTCREPINDENLKCQGLKDGKENHLTDADGTESNLRSSSGTFDPTIRLATSSPPVEKHASDGSSVSRSDQSLNLGDNAGISSAPSAKVASEVNEGILEQKEIGRKFLNDEESRDELTVEDDTGKN